jgi:hypothetical protein
VTEEQLREDVGELTRTLTNEGHEIEHIAPHRWKVIARLIRGSEEKEKWFENFLDADLYDALRCKTCGRSFLVVKVRDNSGTLLSYLVTDEEGDEIDPTDPGCPAKSTITQ